MVPRVAFRELRSVWFQITGTLCNLACRHCFNASGPRDPWLASLPADVILRSIAEAEALGVRELYFTGGEPFLHPEILPLLEAALAVAPTTVLTNGTLIDDGLADALAALAARSPYSLEVRVSLDAATAEANDAVRGRGTFARAMAAIVRLSARGLPPIVTSVVEWGDPPQTPPAGQTRAAGSPWSGRTRYDELREALVAAGVDKPRLKLLPVLPLGRCGGRAGERRLTSEDFEGFDTARLQCTETRVVAAGGIYVCPILAGLPGALVAGETLAETLTPIALGHAACVTCHETGLTCKN
jgi:hypothetical protein